MEDACISYKDVDITSSTRWIRLTEVGNESAGLFGVKEYLPAYLDPSLKTKDLLAGVSFASGTTGYDLLTAKLAVISLPLLYFSVKSYHRNVLTELINESLLNLRLNQPRSGYERDEQFYVSHRARLPARFHDFSVITAGTTGTIQRLREEDNCRRRKKAGGSPSPFPFRRATHDVNSYTDLLINNASSFYQVYMLYIFLNVWSESIWSFTCLFPLQGLYQLGARKIGVLSALPIGCVPEQRVLAGGPKRDCSETAKYVFWDSFQPTERTYDK